LDAVTDMFAWLQPAAPEDVAHPNMDGGRNAKRSSCGRVKYERIPSIGNL
jgi:hypothetical protein